MRLSQALRIEALPRLALVGSGGKTSALFLLGREALDAHNAAGNLARSVLCTTSTHLGVTQCALADAHFVIRQPEDLAQIESDLPPGLLLFTGEQFDGERVVGLDAPSLDRLHTLAENHGLPLFIEADGSRRLPVKAPAAHEPLIPAWVNQVVVVSGLSGLGKPLDAAWVHRPERFSDLTGLPLGAPVTPEALAQELAHPDGGLKGIPMQARRACLLNQADTPELQAAGGRLARSLLPAYQSVLVAALNQSSAEQTDDEELQLSEGAARLWGRQARTGAPVFSAWEATAGIILAAGESKRMDGAMPDGRPKQLLDWRGEPFVRHVARTALEAGLSPVVVVLGAQAPQIRPALDGLPLIIREAAGWQQGQSASLIAGMQAVPGEVGSVIFLLADQPQIPAALIESLLALHAETLAPLVAPQIDGRRANPVLFDRRVFPELLSLSGDSGGRALFARYPVAWLAWLDSFIGLDVDTPEDYRRFLEWRA